MSPLNHLAIKQLEWNQVGRIHNELLMKSLHYPKHWRTSNQLSSPVRDASIQAPFTGEGIKNSQGVGRFHRSLERSLRFWKKGFIIKWIQVNRFILSTIKCWQDSNTIPRYPRRLASLGGKGTCKEPKGQEENRLLRTELLKLHLMSV